MKTLLRTKFGSHLYGMATEFSDTDYKSIIIPDFDFIISESRWTDSKSTGNALAKNTSNDIDEESYSLHGFLKLAYAGDTSAIDMLHATESSTITTSEEWKFLQQNRTKFYTKNLSSYVGYCRKQAAKYCIKGSRLDALKTVIDYLELKLSQDITDLSHPEVVLGLEGISLSNEFVKVITGFHKKDKWIDKHLLVVLEAKYDMTCSIEWTLDQLKSKYAKFGERAKLAQDNEGVDFKALHHALRAGYQARSIYKHGDFEYPLDETRYLIDVKLGNVDFNDIKPVLEELVDEVSTLATASKLPERMVKKDIDMFEDFKYSVYRNNLKEIY